MSDPARNAPAIWLAAGLLASLVLAPALTDIPPDLVADPMMSRHLPPGSLLWAVELEDGRTLLGTRVRATDAGTLLVERRGGRIELRPAQTAGEPPTRRRFWLGTDHLGRDLWARLLHGWRNSLAIALGAALLALGAGAAVGLGAALGGARLDRWLVRWIDVWRALPKVFVLLALAALRQPGPVLLMVALASVSWMAIARQTRTEVLTLRQSGFVQSARTAGCSPLRVAVVHLAPHLRPMLTILGLLQLSSLVLLEASLSFVGAGLSPSTPTLGGLVADAALRGAPSWWTVLFPGLAIVAASLLCHLTAGAVERRAGSRSVVNRDGAAASRGAGRLRRGLLPAGGGQS